MIKRLIVRMHAVSMVFFVSGSFILGSFLHGPLEVWTGITVSPEFSGGKVLYRFRDAYGDDTGEGSYVYPEHPLFETAGVLDLLYYTVYEPQLYPPWQSIQPYWQLGITLAHLKEYPGTAAGFRGPVIRIYLDVSGPKTGSLEMVGTGVQANPSAPWDWMVQIDESQDTARLVLPSGEYRIPMIVIPEQRTIYVRIPLDLSGTEQILAGAVINHYVMTGVYDPFAPESFQPAARFPSFSRGGGAESRDSSRVWDIMLPSGDYCQREILSSKHRIIPPIQTVMPNRSEIGVGSLEFTNFSMDQIEHGLETLATAAKQELNVLVPKNLHDSELSDLDTAIHLFHLGEYEQARNLFTEMYTNSENIGETAVAGGFLGCLLAVDGGRSSSPFTAMQLVRQGMEKLNEAIEMVDDELHQQELLILLTARAGVAESVPESVFGLRSRAAQDYKRAADLVGPDNPRERAVMLVRSAIAWEEAGIYDKADLMFMIASVYRETSAAVAYELAKRGY